MTWKRRQLELARLRQRYHGAKLALEFPDLSVPVATLAPTSDRITECKPWSKGIRASGATISHLHKSGYQVLSSNEVRYAGRKV